MKNLRYIFVLAAALILSSCVQDMDKVVLSDTANTPDKAWSDEATYTGMLAKIYAGFTLTGNQGPYGYDDISNGDTGETAWLRSWFTLQEFCTDEIRVFWDNDGLNDLQKLSWSSDNNWFRITYDRMYLTIAYCNEYLRQTTREQMDARGIRASLQEETQTYREEVKLLRAMNYYFLMDMYGNIPIIVEEDGIGTAQVENKARKDVFKWIEGQVNAVIASGKLPAVGLYGRVNVHVAEMLLAKMYLNAEVYTGEARYNDCITQLDKVIGGGYTLEPQYKHLFGADNHNSPEIIFPLMYDGKKATGYGGVGFIIGVEASLKVPGLPISDIYGVDGATAAWTGGRAPKELFNLFATNDNRALFYNEGMTDEILDLHTGYTQGRLVTKFTNRTRSGSVGADQIFPDTDFPLFRLADAYLMYAEAYARGKQGDATKAKEYVNALRTRAGADQVTETEINDVNFYLSERARELYWEGWRRTDLIRFNSFTQNYNWTWKGGTQTGVMNHDSKYNLYPLPSGELSVNRKLTQNPGY